jgi:ubiquinone/menaquinone biosynthesis C-methylase UbiE
MMDQNKKIIIERYNKYGAHFEDHCREMGGQLDKYLADYLSPYIRPNTLLLDVAGGDGLSTSLLDPNSVSIVSIDIAVGLLEVARSRRKNHLLGVVHDFDHKLPFLDQTFDYVACVSALEFCQNLDFTLAEMMRVLKLNGFMFITTDRYDSNSLMQSEYIYIHDNRGFFSKRYTTEHVAGLIASCGGRIEKSGICDGYLLDTHPIKYDCFLVQKCK